MSSIIKVDAIQKADGTTPTAGDLGLNTTGNVIQVVSNRSTVFNSTTSSSYIEVDSNLRTSITPSSTSSKILIIAALGIGVDRVGSNDASCQIRIREVNSGSTIDETGLRIYDRGNSGIYLQVGQTLSKLVSPATTSTLTYTWDMRLLIGQDCRVNDESKRTYITLLEIVG